MVSVVLSSRQESSLAYFHRFFFLVLESSRYPELRGYSPPRVEQFYRRCGACRRGAYHPGVR